MNSPSTKLLMLGAMGLAVLLPVAYLKISSRPANQSLEQTRVPTSVRKPIRVIPGSRIGDAPESEVQFWASHTPFQVLAELRFRGGEGTSYGFGSTCENFVQDEDVPGLVQLLDSFEPCAHAVLVISSSVPQNRSTLGDQAAYLLEGYRVGRYPPSLGSHDFTPNRAKLKAQFGGAGR